MNIIESVVLWEIGIANDPEHGYSQEAAKRWGPKDYDCSSLQISAWDRAGVKVKAAGASYTGNMKTAFLKCGFIDVTKSVNLATGSGLKRGDVLLRESGHTAMYIGNGMIVHAQSNENGKIAGGREGDQTGREIFMRTYYNSPWSVILRYPENPTYKLNQTFLNADSRELKTELNRIGYKFDLQIQFGPKCWEAVEYEKKNNGVTELGIGPDTWALLKRLPTRK